MQPQANATALLGGLRRFANVVFWLAFYAVGALVVLLSLRSIGNTSPVAILLQSAVAVWTLTLVLHLFRRKAAYATAAVWASMLGAPLAIQVVRRAHQWITVGMDPDGMGSPMVFLLYFLLEWVVFASLCFMLAVLIFARPWRGGQATRGGIASGV